MFRHPLFKLLALYCATQIALLAWGFLARQLGDHRLRYTSLDVGQGDGAVIETPAGHVIVVDTGGMTAEGVDHGGPILTSYLRSEGINSIDALILSHPHADHIGGAAALLKRFRVKRLIDDGVDETVPIMRTIRSVALERNVAYQKAVRGQALNFDDGVRAEVLAPGPAVLPGGANNASVVLHVSYGKASLLFTGDAEAPEEAEMLHSREPLACDVLKVGHHGSRTSSSPDMIAAAHAQIAIVSVGRHNRYGHPNLDVLARLAHSGARIYRTDETGAVTCATDGAARMDVIPMVSSR
jgi:competence protein ComEC